MLLRRLVPCLALIGLATFLASGCSSDDGSTATGPVSSGVPPTDAGAKQPVIVDLAVPREPAAGVERAQDDVMRELGAHGTLTRRLTATAQMGVGVDEEGRRILSRLPLVARVHEDRSDAPTDASAGTVPQSPPSSALTSETTAAPRTAATPGLSASPTTSGPATTAAAAVSPPVPPTVSSAPREQVIVDLAVPAQSPSAVEAAQDEVLGALGDHGTLSRRLTATAQMSVSVDAEGRRILDAHPRVARIQVDMADSATN